MKLILSLTFSCLLTFVILSQSKLVYKGKIGDKNATFNIENCEFESGALIATYHFTNKKESSKLIGEYLKSVIYLLEVQNQDTLAKLYLEENGDSLVGIYLKNAKSYDVKLKLTGGDSNNLKRKTEMDFNKEVSALISGKYQVGENFINYMWVNDENIEPEIGYNGANFSIQELTADSISFSGEAICGPTYHIAFAEGIAVKDGENYVYKSEYGCEIKFTFQNKTVNIVANNSMDCEFGARAYLDHQLYKVADK